MIRYPMRASDEWLNLAGQRPTCRLNYTAIERQQTIAKETYKVMQNMSNVIYYAKWLLTKINSRLRIPDY
jgi:hypothetical protein